MEFRTDEQLSSELQDETINSTSQPISFCQNCQELMNEVMNLRMQIGQYQETERKSKKHFTIAPTLYTFYRNRLDKRQLIRFFIGIPLLLIVLQV